MFASQACLQAGQAALKIGPMGVVRQDPVQAGRHHVTRGDEIPQSPFQQPGTRHSQPDLVRQMRMEICEQAFGGSSPAAAYELPGEQHPGQRRSGSVGSLGGSPQRAPAVGAAAPA